MERIKVYVDEDGIGIGAWGDWIAEWGWDQIEADPEVAQRIVNAMKVGEKQGPEALARTVGKVRAQHENAPEGFGYWKTVAKEEETKPTVRQATTIPARAPKFRIGDRVRVAGETYEAIIEGMWGHVSVGYWPSSETWSGADVLPDGSITNLKVGWAYHLTPADDNVPYDQFNNKAYEERMTLIAPALDQL